MTREDDARLHYKRSPAFSQLADYSRRQFQIVRCGAAGWIPGRCAGSVVTVGFLNFLPREFQILIWITIDMEGGSASIVGTVRFPKT